MELLFSWLESNSDLLEAIAAIAAIVTLLVVVGRQILGSWFKRKSGRPKVPDDRPVSKLETLSDRPSLAFLPLATFATDPEVENLADGLVEDIITQMARVPGIFVVARNSTFVYKGKSHDIRKIGRDLGVRYVVEGSVRKIGEQLRFNAQLIEAETGDHVWAGKTDVDMVAAMKSTDELTNMLVASLQPQIMLAEALRTKDIPTEELTAWELIHQAFSPLFLGFERGISAANSVMLARLAVSIDPDNARAKAALAWALGNLSSEPVSVRGSQDRQADIDEALIVGREAVRMDRRDTIVLYCYGAVLVYAGRRDDGMRYLERALAINPNDAQTLAFLGTILMRKGDSDDGIAMVEDAMKLSPFDPRLYLWNLYLSMGHLGKDDPEKALNYGRKALQLHPGFAMGWLVVAVTSAAMGNDAEALNAVEELKSLDPDYSIEAQIEAMTSGNDAPTRMTKYYAMLKQTIERNS